MRDFEIAVVGAGASGLVAAISAKRRGSSVAVFERMPRAGKKILASGGGRCNMLNERLDESFFNKAARDLVRGVFSRFGKEEVLKFFDGLGLCVFSEEGRIFPATNQSSSVTGVLEAEIRRLGIPLRLNCCVTDIERRDGGYNIKVSSGDTVMCKKVILAGGGRSYPALGSDGNSYALARRLGHSIIAPVPSAVALLAKDGLCHLLQGQKIRAHVKAMRGEEVLSESGGELLFTKYGLSGTAILDVSEEVSIAMNRRHEKGLSISVDMVPFLKRESLAGRLSSMARKGARTEELLSGILPNKFAPALKDLLNGVDFDKIAAALKNRIFKLSGTRGWNEAEFTSGGVDTAEVRADTLESKIKRGAYFAGELLDVQGRRGGYNLAWAWASGFVAGLAQDAKT